jgi:hypothetical protein
MCGGERRRLPTSEHLARPLHAVSEESKAQLLPVTLSKLLCFLRRQTCISRGGEEFAEPKSRLNLFISTIPKEAYKTGVGASISSRHRQVRRGDLYFLAR